MTVVNKDLEAVETDFAPNLQNLGGERAPNQISQSVEQLPAHEQQRISSQQTNVSSELEHDGEDTSNGATEDGLPSELPNSVDTSVPPSDVEHGQDTLRSPTGTSSSPTMLVEATAVINNQDDDMIPSAVEYDPEAKPPLYRRKHFLLWLLALATAVVAVAVTLGIALGNGDSGSSGKERSGAEEIRVEIEAKVDTGALDEHGKSHTLAMNWIVHEDPRGLSAEDPNLLQRYLLAVFYFQTHEDGNEWKSCNAPSDNQDSYCSFQELIGIEPVTYKSRPGNRWLSEAHECFWAGIICDDLKVVVSLKLSGQHIAGRLPNVLTHIPTLAEISLQWNQFTGTIPEGYGDFSNLRYLALPYNDLSGTLPQNLSNATDLVMLDVGGNSKIGGFLPDDIGRLTQLKGLLLFNTNMRGEIASHISLLSSLEFLRVGYTQFSGTLPTEIGRMPLMELWMENTLVGGTIPSEIGLATRLRQLRLHNSKIHSSIPEELWHVETMSVLDLYGTRISGTLSSNIGKLTDLHALRLSDTLLSGPLPTELSTLTGLSFVRLEEAGFTGQVPPGLCDIADLEELITDCLMPSNGGKPMVECECCTQCCNSTTGWCE